MTAPLIPATARHSLMQIRADVLVAKLVLSQPDWTAVDGQSVHCKALDKLTEVCGRLDELSRTLAVIDEVTA